MKNIFITGATSFIGLHLLEYLKDKNVNVTVMVRPQSTHKRLLDRFPDINILELGLDEVGRIDTLLKDVDACIHLAWNGTRVPERYDDKIQEENYASSVKLFKSMEKLGCKVFMGVGSQAEYGFTDELITEETKCNPNTAYGVYKLKTCTDLLEMSTHSNMRYIWGRIFSIYGEGDYEKTLIMSSIKKMINNEDIDMTEGKQYWNYLYVRDLVKILWLLITDMNACGIYNLASDDTKMLKDYMYEMKEALNSESHLNLGAVPYRQEGIVNIKPDITKLKSYIHKYEFIKFTNGVKNINEFYNN